MKITGDGNESAFSYCLGVSPQHQPSQQRLPRNKVASSIYHRNGNTNSKVFTQKFNTYFISQSEKQVLPSPRGFPIKTQETHIRTHKNQHRKQASILQTSGKHVNFRISLSFGILVSPSMPCARTEELSNGHKFKTKILE